MKSTEERLIWLGAGVMSYAILQIGGLYYGVFFILGLGLLVWGVLRLRRGRTTTGADKRLRVEETDTFTAEGDRRT